MKSNKFKLLAGVISLVLLGILLIRLVKYPISITSPVYLPVLIAVGILGGSAVVAGLLKVLFNRASYWVMLFSIVSISCIALIVKFHSPKLTVVVPKGYEGQVNLVLSNEEKDILIVDSNGIGYITKRTFDKTYLKPIVLESDGTDISDQCVGFNASAFWGKVTSEIASSSSADLKQNDISSLSFEIVPKDKKGQKQYYNVDLTKFVDRARLYQE